MTHDIRDLAERLAQRALDVCTTYLSNGQRQGRYWLVGDVTNLPGRSLYVRVVGPHYGPGAAGKWTDAATGEHGDLIDLIRLNRNCADWLSLREEILAFLALPSIGTPTMRSPVARNSPAAARRLLAMGVPVPGTLAATYLRSRGITAALDDPALRFHPSCYHRTGQQTRELPALLAAVTDLNGDITGVLRTYLAPDGLQKAPVDEPRRMLGHVLHHAIRLGRPGPVLAVGEGLETMLAVRSLLPSMPINAAMGAGHLAALLLPRTLERLYVAHDNGAAGVAAANRLTQRARADGLDVRWLTPCHDDWNADLLRDPIAAAALLAAQLDDADTMVLQAATGKGSNQRELATVANLQGPEDAATPGLSSRR